MKRILVAVVVASLTFAGAVTAEAAPKSSVVTTAFKTLLNTTADSLESLEGKYETDVSALDDALTAATKAADLLLAQELQAATDLYTPQIATANQKLEAAKILFSNNSDLKIQQSLFSWQNADRIYSLLICPETTLPAGAGMFKSV